MVWGWPGPWATPSPGPLRGGPVPRPVFDAPCFDRSRSLAGKRSTEAPHGAVPSAAKQQWHRPRRSSDRESLERGTVPPVPSGLRPSLYPNGIPIPQHPLQPHFQPPVTAPQPLSQSPVTAPWQPWNCPLSPPPFQKVLQCCPSLIHCISRQLNNPRGFPGCGRGAYLVVHAAAGVLSAHLVVVQVRHTVEHPLPKGHVQIHNFDPDPAFLGRHFHELRRGFVSVGQAEAGDRPLRRAVLKGGGESGWRRLAAVGGGWQLVVGGWWSLEAALRRCPKQKKGVLKDSLGSATM